MAHCERGNEISGITVYKRHKFKNGVCKCGVQQTEHLRAIANRRTRRKQERLAAKQIALATAGTPQV